MYELVPKIKPKLIGGVGMDMVMFNDPVRHEIVIRILEDYEDWHAEKQRILE